ncbi:MAG: hypothetical protein J6Y95_05750, partial [Lachnospiraceae bacterium]|nr:hypothetical protein [Lachnospiraceae bacterium]
CWVVTALSKALDFRNGLSESRSAVPGIYGSIRSLEAGGACLKWLQKNVLSSEHADFETIDREAAKRPAAEDGLFFFPETGKDGSGLMTRSCFSGISLSHDRYHLARAVMEGVSFQLKWMLEEFPSAPSPDGILLSGGASKSGFWSQITSDILGLPVRVPDAPDLPCFGAAMLAAYGAGETASLNETVKRYRPEETVVYPSGKKEAYQKAYQLYQNCAAHAGSSGGR